MILQKTGEIIFYFKHDGLTLELDQDVISSIGLVEMLKKIIKEKYKIVKSFSISLVGESTFEIEVSIMDNLSWKT